MIFIQFLNNMTSAGLCDSCGVVTFFVGPATAQNTHTYSKAVQKACANDYHAHCGQYGIETEALRLCMDKAGHGSIRLPKWLME